MLVVALDWVWVDKYSGPQAKMSSSVNLKTQLTRDLHGTVIES